MEAASANRDYPGNSRWRAVLASGLILIPCALASARPESIRAGVSYYSDEMVESGSIRDIGVERNYEEVYQFYTYYEVSYDANERVDRFLEYKRGEAIRTDIYRYSADGGLLDHIVELPGKPPKPVPIDTSKRKDVAE